MKIEKVKVFIFGLIFILLQIVLFRHLRLFGMQPDLVLLFILWMMTRQDRTTTIIIASSLGLIQDALLDLWGLNMFAKTVIAFFAYRFVPNVTEYRLLTGQAFLLISIIALFHNIIMLSLSFFIEVYNPELTFWQMLIGDTLYTSIIGILLYTLRSS